MTSISIVIVSFEDATGLQQTLASIRNIVREGGAEVQVVVADGGSSYDVSALVAKLVPNATVFSARDGGIYQGMNRGLRATTGDHVWFLNGGDSASAITWASMREILVLGENKVILNDFLLEYPGGHTISRRAHSPRYIFHALPTSHQAIFYPGNAARSCMYEIDFSVSADYAFTAQLWISGIEFYTSRVPVAIFRPGGTSTGLARQISKDAWRVQREILGLPVPFRWFSKSLFLLARLRAGRRFRALSVVQE